MTKKHLIDYKILKVRTKKDYLTVTVGIVSERRDSYRTIIKPDGAVNDFRSVHVDYNHNRINTGAKVVEDKGVQEIDIKLNGEDKRVKSRVVEIRVWKKNRAWTEENKDRNKSEVPSLYDYVESGRIKDVSVDFEEISEETTREYDANDNLKTVIFNKWRLNYLSLIDKRAGQDETFFIGVRTKKNNLQVKNLRMLEAIQKQIKEILEEKNIVVEEISEISQEYYDEKSGRIKFTLNNKSEHAVEYVVEDNKMVLNDEVENLNEDLETEEEAEAEGEDELQESEDDDEVENDDEDRKGDDYEKDQRNKRDYLGMAVKNNESGKMFVVTSLAKKIKDGGDTTTEYELTGLDGEVVNESGDISYSDENGKYSQVENTFFMVEAFKKIKELSKSKENREDMKEENNRLKNENQRLKNIPHEDTVRTQKHAVTDGDDFVDINNTENTSDDSSERQLNQRYEKFNYYYKQDGT